MAGDKERRTLGGSGKSNSRQLLLMEEGEHHPDANSQSKERRRLPTDTWNMALLILLCEASPVHKKDKLTEWNYLSSGISKRG